MNSLSTILILSFMIILCTFIMNYSHLLMSLLYLEAMTLCMVLFIPNLFMVNASPIHQLSLILLTFSACEASLGLSLIVMLSRTNGSDMLSSNSLNKC